MEVGIRRARTGTSVAAWFAKGVFDHLAQIEGPDQPQRFRYLRGELVDKITILEIKETRLASPKAIANVRQELSVLTDAAQDAHCNNVDLARVKAELRMVNEKLWSIEDRIRAKEAGRRLDREFVELARSVYFENDKRADLKGRINRLMNSEIVEEKQYVGYDRESDSSPLVDSHLLFENANLRLKRCKHGVHSARDRSKSRSRMTI